MSCPQNHVEKRDKYGSCVYCKQESKKRRRKLNSDAERKKRLLWRKNNPEKVMLQECKRRAKVKGIAFGLSLEDITIPDVCPVFGFVLSNISEGDKLTSPSIDRIDNENGYTKDNIVVVSYMANRIKNRWTPSQLKAVSDFYNRGVL